MRNLFDDNETVIREYCEKNGLSFEKAKYSPCSFNQTEVHIQHVDEKIGRLQLQGLLDETPAPVILKIVKTDNGLLFEQTEHTARYLSI
jgi:hypothetical protein